MIASCFQPAPAWGLTNTLLAAGLLGLLPLSGWAADAPQAVITPEQERFFEEKVRPVLAANCQECHGAKKQESSLRLDSRTAALAGGASGAAAIVPGEPERSLLVKAINHVGDYHMPPKRKMTGDEVAVLTTWIKEGARGRQRIRRRQTSAAPRLSWPGSSVRRTGLISP